MPAREIELALKRGRLQERIAGQRAALATQVVPIAKALGTADQAVALGHASVAYVKHHPGQVGAALAILAFLRPKRIWRWGRRALVAWGIWKKVRDSLEGARMVIQRNAA